MINHLFDMIYTLLFAITSMFVGHEAPMQAELLSNPQTLNCGLVIREMHNSNINVNDVDKLCSVGKAGFFSFIKNKKIILKNKSDFNYSVSFLPDNHNYRSLNDINFRFAHRAVREDVTGYTLHELKYIFLINNSADSEFNVTFMHELFHAFSDHYGIYSDFHGSSEEKIFQDELLAQEFTKYLGFGI